MYPATALASSVSSHQSQTVSSPTPTVSDDTSEATLSLSFTTPLSLLVTAKDVREYEYDRKRTKKAAAFANRKAAKDSWTQALPRETRVTPCGLGKESLRSIRSEDFEIADAFSVHSQKAPAVATSARISTSPSYPSSSEVKLADFLTSKKPRKGRHGDFEFIPHVRSVIVLDDFNERHMSLDEPWEYINGAEDLHSSSDSDTGSTSSSKNAVVSYATVLSTK